MEKWYERFHDAGFTQYNESGEAICVHIIRDRAFDIDTTDKWIDVISSNMYTTMLKASERHSILRFEFNWIIVELFPRITHPKYTKNDTARNKYICWKAAHDDIKTHRENGHHGEKYIVLCRTVKTQTTDPKRSGYEYQVTAFSRIKQKRINYIVANATELANKIRRNPQSALEKLTVG